MCPLSSPCLASTRLSVPYSQFVNLLLIVELQVFVQGTERFFDLFELTGVEVVKSGASLKGQTGRFHLLAEVNPDLDFSFFDAGVPYVFVSKTQRLSDRFFGPIEVGVVQRGKAFIDSLFYFFNENDFIVCLKKEVGEQLFVFYFVFTQPKDHLLEMFWIKQLKFFFDL
jgi:hypothetical protein